MDIAMIRAIKAKGAHFAAARPTSICEVAASGTSLRSLSTAALLHDTIEDTETDVQELEGQFGPDVARIVQEVTDTKWLQKTARKQLQISKASKSSHGAKLVKIADKIANLRDIMGHPPADWSLERKREHFDWAKRVVDGVRGTSEALERRFDSLYRQRP